MKKILLVTFVLLTTVIYSSFSAGLEKLPLSSSSKEPAITSLVINADVTIVLVNDKDQPFRIIGDILFMEQVTCKQTGSTLIVGAGKNRNWKNKGIVYIPANSLRSIQINNDAYVRSATTLNIPKLDLEVNGSCKVSVLTLGEVTLTRSDSYEIEYSIRKIPLYEPFNPIEKDR